MRDTQLKRVLIESGRYYRSAALFYHELWRDYLHQIGCLVIKSEKLEQRVRITSSAQLHMLLCSPPTRKAKSDTDPVEHRMKTLVRAFASSLGTPIRNDFLTVSRTGHYCTVAFIWPPGKPGCLLRKEKKPSAFGFLIRPWLKRNRN